MLEEGEAMQRHRWAKVDADLDANPKVVMAGNLARQVFEFALRRNAKEGLTGVVKASSFAPAYLARTLQLDSEQDAAKGLARAIEHGLLRVDGDVVVLVGWDDEWAARPMTGAERQAKYMGRKRARDDGRSDAMTANDGGDAQEKERDLDLEERSRSGSGADSSGTVVDFLPHLAPDMEILRGATSPPPPKPEAPAAVIEIPLTKGDRFGVSADQIREWSEAYPAVNVLAELRRMRAWSAANPTKRKTKRGVSAFVNRWLDRAQNEASGRGGGGRAALDDAWWEERRARAAERDKNRGGGSGGSP